MPLLIVYFVFFGTFIPDKGVITRSGFADFSLIIAAYFIISFLLDYYFPSTKDSKNNKDHKETDEK
jgi:hypothetical protein